MIVTDWEYNGMGMWLHVMDKWDLGNLCWETDLIAVMGLWKGTAGTELTEVKLIKLRWNYFYSDQTKYILMKHNWDFMGQNVRKIIELGHWCIKLIVGSHGTILFREEWDYFHITLICTMRKILTVNNISKCCMELIVWLKNNCLMMKNWWDK